MLTIKHVERSGYERVKTAEEVTYDPAVGENNEYPKGQVLAFGSLDDPGWDRYATGILYVMNAHGSTVATYRLD